MNKNFDANPPYINDIQIYPTAYYSDNPFIVTRSSQRRQPSLNDSRTDFNPREEDYEHFNVNLADSSAP